MPEQRGWVGLLLLVSAIAVVAGTARAARAAEDDDLDLSVPSVCAPPCPDQPFEAPATCVPLLSKRVIRSDGGQ